MNPSSKAIETFRRRACSLRSFIDTWLSDSDTEEVVTPMRRPPRVEICASFVAMAFSRNFRPFPLNSMMPAFSPAPISQTTLAPMVYSPFPSPVPFET